MLLLSVNPATKIIGLPAPVRKNMTVLLQLTLPTGLNYGSLRCKRVCSVKGWVPTAIATLNRITHGSVLSSYPVLLWTFKH